MHIHDVVTLYNNCPFLCACASTAWSVHVVAKYKNRNENNTQYPFYTVAVKHETGKLVTLTHSLVETKVQITTAIPILFACFLHFGHSYIIMSCYISKLNVFYYLYIEE